MKPFLKELAEKIIAQHKKLEDVTVIFPNRRAALFFRKYLADSIVKPAWSPKLLSIEEFFSGLSELREPDRLSLIFRLYKIYGTVMKREEPFDRFYFWGEMLLRDFDEVDKYLIDAPLLFKDLSQLKELDESFDYLTDEQKEFLRKFWIGFDERPSVNKEEFLKVWKKLPDVYSKYTKALRKEGLGYEGMIHRDVIDRIEKINAKQDKNGQLIFAGFNALTKAEEMMISHFVEAGAQVEWDLDDYYLNDRQQEAGQFMRQYQKHPVLGKTFEGKASSFLKSEKNINLTGVPQRIGQSKLVGQVLDERLLKGLDPEKTVIVLPDESMLLPVLHSLPPSLDNINVTMGYPLRNTPLYNLLDLIIELQLQRRGDDFSHRQVTAILRHTYMVAMDEKNSVRLRNDILDKNRVYIPVSELQAEGILADIFKVVESKDASAYLLYAVERFGSAFTDQQSFDREYAFHFHRHLARLQEVLNDSTNHPDWRGYQKLFRQVVLSQKIPFTGEPLKGIQVMGVLETRNLDFENVFVLSLNEGMLPASAKQGSYIPHSIRRAYSLPTYEHQDAIYAYLFYRLLQRADNIDLYYNTEPDILGDGEMSRYVQQLIYESGIPMKQFILHNSIQVSTPKPVTVHKTPEVMALLDVYRSDSEKPKPLSPSALNDYVDCRLKFYLKHLAHLKEADEVEEDLDARVFGNLLHKIIFWFYEDLNERKNGRIEKADLSNVTSRIDALTDRAFIEHYHLDPTKPVVYEGQRVVVQQIVREFVSKILSFDEIYAPFAIDLLEKPVGTTYTVNSNVTIKIGGTIDRVDSKEGNVRVIDYKTGGDKPDFDSIESLFDSSKGRRNKAAFQTILYSWLYEREKVSASGKLIPGLMNRASLFTKDFVFGHMVGKRWIPDIKTHFNLFEPLLNQKLAELYDPEQPFDQTQNITTCEYCPYKNICYRN
ncbi:MAG: PD-(D/E)XK nuclease family protein [Cyclobacteriaceae bacterium]|nr:PD-(D/E)XK nuclease family protein [Cyclobacteriaceae bacterium]